MLGTVDQVIIGNVVMEKVTVKNMNLAVSFYN